MILGSGAPPGPNDSVTPESLAALPTPSETLVTGVEEPRPFSTASSWSSDAFCGFLPSMRLPVRIVPAESWPLAFDR